MKFIVEVDKKEPIVSFRLKPFDEQQKVMLLINNIVVGWLDKTGLKLKTNLPVGKIPISLSPSDAIQVSWVGDAI